jgi:hypothetical protein
MTDSHSYLTHVYPEDEDDTLLLQKLVTTYVIIRRRNSEEHNSYIKMQISLDAVDT